MAKKSKSMKVTPSKPPEAVVAAAAAVTQLNANYRLGQRLNQGTAPDLAELQEDAAKYPGGISYSNCRKMQQLAKTVTNEKWLTLTELRSKTTGLPLSWSHLIALASVHSEDELMKAATLAADESWSSANLRRHLQRAAGTGSRRPGTGPKIQDPSSVADGLQQLLVDLEPVRKRVTALRKLKLAGLADKLAALDVAVAAIREAPELDHLFEVPLQPQS